MGIVRVLRVIEYVGPRNQVEDHLKKCLHGSRPLSPFGGEIRAATIGLVPDILEMEKVENLLPSVTEQIRPQATPTLCSICGEPQLITPSGAICSKGHGGAPSMEDKPDAEGAPFW